MKRERCTEKLGGLYDKSNNRSREIRTRTWRNKKLREYTKVYGEKGVYAIVDSFILKNYREDIEASYNDSSTELVIEEFGGESSRKEIDKHVEKAKEIKAEVIIGIGGGKTLDTAKAVAYYARLPVAIVPTAASADAPSTALTVIYTEDGQFDEYLFLPTNPDIVIMDEEIIINAPVRLFASGIGDALATFYEADAARRSNGITLTGDKQTKAGMALAKLCLETLLEDGIKAVASVKNKSMTQAVSNIIEANTFLSGVGAESGGLAAAHAIHNGMTVLEDLHHLTHGEKVAFGTLTQMVMENRPEEEILDRIDFCKEIGLPTTFEELGIPEVTKEELLKVAALANDENDTMGNMPFDVSEGDIVGAMFVVNELAKFE